MFIDETFTPQIELTKGEYANGERVMAAGKPFVRFFNQSMQLGFESQEAQRPVFTTVPFMELRHPGERDTICRRATRDDAMRWIQEWKAYQAGRNEGPQGTPMSILFPSDPGICNTLKALDVHTVEQLAELTDTALGNIGMGARDWMMKAQRYMEAVEKGKGFGALEAEVEKRTTAITDLRNENRMLKQRLDDLDAAIRSGAIAQQHAGVGAMHLQGGFSQPGGEAGASTRYAPRVPEQPQDDFIDADDETPEAPRRGPGRPRRN
jgi:hypothetical protein